MTETILTIAGSDPTGGAGIQTDLKTFTVLGAYGAAVPTCITVQNSYGVTRIEPLAPDLVGAQIDAVLADHRVGAIKIGMIGTREIGAVILERIRGFAGPVVVDPVLTATTGQSLLTDAQGGDDWYARFCGRADLATPNLAELAVLTGTTIHNRTDIVAAARLLMEKGERLRAVVATGGDAAGASLTDYLVQREGETIRVACRSHPRIKTENSHGTGCTFSSALAVSLMRGMPAADAFDRGVAFIRELLQENADRVVIRNPAGKGPFLHHLCHHKKTDSP